MSPVYEFNCPNCGGKVEQVQSMKETLVSPTCGDCLVEMKRVFSPTPAQFKGGGWGGSK